MLNICVKNFEVGCKSRAVIQINLAWKDGWVGGWKDVKAGLRIAIAYSNQKLVFKYLCSHVSKVLKKRCSFAQNSSNFIFCQGSQVALLTFYLWDL